MLRDGMTLEQRKILICPKGTAVRGKINVTYIALWLVVLVNFIGILCVLYAMVAKVSSEQFNLLVSSTDTLSALKTTLLSVVISVGLIGIIGTAVAYIITTHKGVLFNWIEAITFIPLVLPPSVAGLGLLMTFGKNGVIGAKLAEWGIHLPFTFFAIILVQVFVCLPFYIQIVKNGFEAVEADVIEAAKVFGAGERILLFKIYMPISIKAIFTGLILCSLRAAGEFGATIMFAGNMVGKTQTLTTRIYSLYQYDIKQAVALAVFQLFILLVPTLLLKYFLTQQSR